MSLHSASGAQIGVAGGANSWAKEAKPAPALAQALATGKPAASAARCGYLALDCQAWAMPTRGGALVAYYRRVEISAGRAADSRPSVDRLGLAAALLALSCLLALPSRRRNLSPNGAPASVD